MNRFVVAFDGGGSKTDAVAVSLDGALLAHATGPTSSPHFVGLGRSLAVVDALMTKLVGDAVPDRVGVFVSGLDLPVEVDEYAAAVAERPWANGHTVVENDLFALLRAGTDARDAVAVVCGTGINAIGVRADGATARFAALGPISGDWGGGGGIGEEALWFAARDEDGRGDPTALTRIVAAHFGHTSISQVTEELHFGRLKSTELATLSPLVFAAAVDGDAIAASIVDRQAREIGTMAAAALRRLGLLDRPVPVVLGGGVIRSGDSRLLDGVRAMLAQNAPLAHIEIVTAPPIVGAAILALEHAGATREAIARAREAIASA